MKKLITIYLISVGICFAAAKAQAQESVLTIENHLNAPAVFSVFNIDTQQVVINQICVERSSDVIAVSTQAQQRYVVYADVGSNGCSGDLIARTNAQMYGAAKVTLVGINGYMPSLEVNQLITQGEDFRLAQGEDYHLHKQGEDYRLHKQGEDFRITQTGVSDN